MGYAQLVIGPAGSGKSTYCSSLQQHCETIGRMVHIVNLDPAAESFDYPVAMDVRELISVDDVMEELQLGPNGGLIYCMEHLEECFDDWLAEELENYLEDDYLVFDCPGQIELFTHVPVLKNLVEYLKRKNFNICAVYLLDSQFVTDVTKYISGCMASLSAMIQLELPHVNILSKMDLVANKKDVEDFLDPEARVLLSELNIHMAPQFAKLNKALVHLVKILVASQARGLRICSRLMFFTPFVGMGLRICSIFSGSVPLFGRDGWDSPLSFGALLLGSVISRLFGVLSLHLRPCSVGEDHWYALGGLVAVEQYCFQGREGIYC